MAKEIERKFLINTDEWKEVAKEQNVLGNFLKQVYIVNEPWGITRLRLINNPIDGEKAFIAIKTRSGTISRDEYEYEIPVQDAKELFKILKDHDFIEKTRYPLEYKGHIWEVDEFKGNNTGLVVAEIELKSIEEEFEKPSWVGEEVSKVSRYFNSQLAKSKSPLNKVKEIIKNKK